MEYIVVHKTIKLWNIYKPMIYLKDGPHTSPLMDLNVGQYIKRAMTQRYRYSASLLSI